MTHAISSTMLDGLTVRVYRSELDGRLVVDIEGPGDSDLDSMGSPVIAVYLNEETLYTHTKETRQ